MSAYINKALQKNGTYVKQFSNPCHWLKIQEQFSKFKLTFSQFIDCLLFNAKTDFRKHSTTSEQLDLSSRSAGIYLDHHWAPQVHLSKPCTTNYTLIGKQEHFADDISAIIKILNFHRNSFIITIDIRGLKDMHDEVRPGVTRLDQPKKSI